MLRPALQAPPRALQTQRLRPARSALRSPEHSRRKATVRGLPSLQTRWQHLSRVNQGRGVIVWGIGHVNFGGRLLGFQRSHCIRKAELLVVATYLCTPGVIQTGQIRSMISYMQLFFFPPDLLTSPFLLTLPSSRNSDPGSHCRLPPHPLYGTCLHIYREKGPSLSSLVNSRRIVYTSMVTRTE